MNTTDMMRQAGIAIAYVLESVQLTDAEALTVKNLHKQWSAGENVEPGEYRLYNDVLYRVNEGQGHTTQADWTPDKTPAMWTVIDEEHAGTYEDPIPWVTNMRPEVGKYYVEGDLIAKCIEDPGQALYNKLSELVPGRYFENA